MRKKLSLLLIVATLLAMVISCELDTLSSLMGTMGENTLTAGRAVPMNTAQVDAVTQSVSSLLVENSGTSEMEVDEAQVDELKSALRSVEESSPEVKAALQEQLSAPADATVSEDYQEAIDTLLEEVRPGPLEEMDPVVEEIFTSLGISLEEGEEPDISTEGDLLVTTLIVDTMNTIQQIIDDSETSGEEPIEQFLEIVPDLRLLVDTINNYSSDTFIDQHIDFDALMEQFMSQMDES